MPFEKYSELKGGRRESLRRENKRISAPSLGGERRNILYTVVKLCWTLTRTGNLSIVNAIVLFCILCCF